MKTATKTRPAIARTRRAAKHEERYRSALLISSFDKQRLTVLLDALDRTAEEREELEDLEREIERGAVVRPEEIPADVVTMNSTVRVSDCEDGTASVYTIVFPGNADYERGRISILAPLGIALLGYRVGDTVDWNMPGRTRKLRIDEIVYQPEAAGDYHL